MQHQLKYLSIPSGIFILSETRKKKKKKRCCQINAFKGSHIKAFLICGDYDFMMPSEKKNQVVTCS